jgi:aspartyl-tRNA(Asn)/glutamyl-tRNA(Gln) amidotransferase subunit B
MSLEDNYLITVGLEVHTELRTKTKLFCGCANEFGAEPNTNTCPVCLGLPGSLPVVNRKAVEYAMRIGTALNCEIKHSVFHRKNYFYPDMPKDYQVTQYDEPTCINGYIELPITGKVVNIVRAHIEEDTGKSTHIGTSGRITGADYSLVDYNRSGIPLVEIVSAPDMVSGEEAREYVSELRSILVSTGATDGKMEEGSLRVDANVSVRKVGTDELGTRCEIKNLNSLRSLVRAITYEARRQMEIVDGGGKVTQETRHWNEDLGRTSSLRSKEEAYDYRYFPEPDLSPLDPSVEEIEAIKANLGALPPKRRAALVELVGDSPSKSEIEQIQTVINFDLDDLIFAGIEKGVPAKLSLARCANEVAGLITGLDESYLVPSEKLLEVLVKESLGELTPTQSKAVLARVVADRAIDVAALIAELGFVASSSDEMDSLVGEIIAESPSEWERYLSGEDQLAGFFVGKAMKKSGGKANGKLVSKSLNDRRSQIHG